MELKTAQIQPPPKKKKKLHSHTRTHTHIHMHAHACARAHTHKQKTIKAPSCGFMATGHFFVPYHTVWPQWLAEEMQLSSDADYRIVTWFMAFKVPHTLWLNIVMACCANTIIKYHRQDCHTVGVLHCLTNVWLEIVMARCANTIIKCYACAEDAQITVFNIYAFMIWPDACACVLRSGHPVTTES